MVHSVIDDHCAVVYHTLTLSICVLSDFLAQHRISAKKDEYDLHMGCWVKCTVYIGWTDRSRVAFLIFWVQEPRGQ